ncbi:hypothetical protein [Streptomyces sp. NPDC053048]|uniref:hypothetical protein n=1 Tax=Streptomyces sp. NPDC053048 TaxID=3365694 RepID=UPI0037D77131
MTKNGPSGPKKRARARQERDGSKYTQARRGEAAAEQPTLTVYRIEFNNGEPVPWEAPRSWSCHHCGATGTDLAGTDDAKFVRADGVTYLRPHCPQCLPEPETKRFPDGYKYGDPKPEEWKIYDAEEWQRSRTLIDAVRAGTVTAQWLDMYRCSVHGGIWNIGPRVQLPCGVLYDSSTDLYEHPCSTCWDSKGREELGRAHYERSRQI